MQLTLPSMQMSLVEKVRRAYVKVIGYKAYWRLEKSLTPNEHLSVAREKISKTARTWMRMCLKSMKAAVSSDMSRKAKTHTLGVSAIVIIHNTIAIQFIQGQ